MNGYIPAMPPCDVNKDGTYYPVLMWKITGGSIEPVCQIRGHIGTVEYPYVITRDYGPPEE